MKSTDAGNLSEIHSLYTSTMLKIRTLNVKPIRKYIKKKLLTQHKI
jgi:hypothetical protein